jgi:DNA-binding MarR family transcriptional regulator
MLRSSEAKGGAGQARPRCLCATVRRAGRVLTRRYEEALRPAGLSVSQFELMMALRATGGASQGRLAELLETDQTTLSRNLKVLVRERRVEESIDTTDGRKRVYGVSTLGAEVLAEGMRCWTQVHGEMEGLLGGRMGEVWGMLDGVMEAARVVARG